MYRSLAIEAGRTGFRGSVQVLMEEKMACGVGTCGSCTVRTVHGERLVCTDGPRFELRDLIL
jgi:dihydroorotate dehydrogenase electron transfer subunit